MNVAGDSDFRDIHKFFLHQSKLRKLRLRIKGGTINNSKMLLFLIVKNSPELVELEFRSEVAIRFSAVEFTHFLNEIKRLKSLNLYFKKFSLEKEVLEVSSIEYFRLKKLQLECKTMDVDFNRITRKILYRCRSLQYLCLKFVAKDVLQEILENQVREHFL